jgi:peptidoglycan/LPS O-acetylase OafA/YrhL
MLSISLGFWLILACALNSMDFVVRIPGAGFIARLAFTLYLSHKIVLVWIKEHLISRLPNSDFLVFIVYAASILLVAAVLHFMVERPVLNWRDRHFKEPNQALLPTTMSVTPRACARVAPDTVAADL